LLQELIARTPAVVTQVADRVLGGLLGAARALEGMPTT